MIRYKTCKDCGGDKPLTEFSRNSSMSDGYINTCKNCAALRKHDLLERRKHNPVNNLLKKWGRC